MDAFSVFGIQQLFSFVVFGLLAWWYVWPWLKSVDRTAAFTALTFVHAFRPIGATVLVASVAGAAVPRDFAEAVAYGDLVTSLLAVVTLLALRKRFGFAIALVWLTNARAARPSQRCRPPCGLTGRVMNPEMWRATHRRSIGAAPWPSSWPSQPDPARRLRPHPV